MQKHKKHATHRKSTKGKSKKNKSFRSQVARKKRPVDAATRKHQRGGSSSCGGEYALVQGVHIAANTAADPSFNGLSINDQMAKVYNPSCSQGAAQLAGPMYKV